MKKMQFRILWVGLMVSFIAVTSHAVPNPAAAYAEKLGYVYTANEAGGTVTMPDGTVLNAWDFFRGKVGSEYAYGAQYGYDTVNRRVETNGYVQSFAVCVPKDSRKRTTPAEISLLDLMRQNGEPLWDYSRGATPAAVESILKTAPLKTFPKQALPSSFDWRNVGGLSYIGAVRDQGSCGSCYSFGAAAAAEGAFNYTLGKTGSNCANFSEAYIAWCLGTYGAYSSHFGGCDGADYDYQELEALTVEGVCNETQMPYNGGADPGSCTWSGTTTVFEAWYRVPSGDIDAIKTAIMTYGVVDAAVLTDDAFMDYDTGVYDNNNNDCNSGYNETSDHAISLVGWDDNPPEGGGGVFILRNSWGASGTGEGGYMRIRTNAAVVHCAVCYMVYDSSISTTSAPAFTSGTNYTATTGVARTFTVTASGNPTPALSLLSSTATAGSYAFSNATGVLSYTPPTNDVGTKTFTFRATNVAGSVTQQVQVVVSLAPPAAPASIWASATNQTDFTAAWSSVSGASGYRLDVGTNNTFTGGGGGGASELFISEYIEADSGSEKYIEIFNGTGSSVNLANYSLLMFINGSTSPTTIALAGTLANNDVFVVANSSATNAAVIDQTSGSLTFNGDDAIALSKTTTHAYVDILGQIGTDPGTEWGTDPTTTANSTLVRKSSIAAGDTNGTDAFDPATEWNGYAGVNVEDDLGSHTFTGGGAPSYMAGYSNRAVAGTSQSVTGLTAGATYYFRVRATNTAGASANSSVASVTTLATLSAPVFGANPGPVATTAGVQKVFTVSASGVPAPTLALQSQTASGGYSFTAGTGQLTYTPPQADTGTRTFTFSASNSQGTASQVVTVNVTAATAPAFTGGAGPYSTTAGVAVAFTVSASGTPAATLALQSQTASSGYSFTPATGAFTYTPPEADVGTQTFTFTAANAAGTVTQTTSVAVSAVPTAPAAPAAIWASVTNATTFTAAWSTVSNATSYRLDVGTNNTFSGGGGGGGGTNISENIQSWTAHGSYGNWTETIAAGTVSMTDCIVQPAASASGVGSIGRVQLKASTGIVELPAINTAGTVTMNIAAGGADRTAKLQKYNGSTWDDLTTWTGIGATGAAFTYAVNDSGASVQLRIASPSAAIYVHDIIVTASGGGGTPSYVAGYSNRTVAGTSESVTGLTGAVTYYFRARAVNAIGTSGNSPTGQVTTKSGMSDQTISAFLPTNGSAFAASAAVGLSATASSGLAVTFAVASGPGTVNGTNLTFTGAGSVAVVASQAGNGSWNPAPNVTNTYSVSKASATVTLGNLDQAYDGTARPVTVATAPAGLGVTVTYAGHSWAPTNVGTYAVTATVSDAVYQGSGSGTLTVTEAIQPGTVSSNAVVVTFGPLVNGSNYVLEYRASLTTGTWVEVTNVTGTGTANTTVTNVTGTADFGYYRVEGVTGPSAELLGYARVDKPGNGKLNVVGVPFLSSNQTLNSLMDPLQFTGHYNNAGQADQLMLWNPATTSYVNLALYDLRSFGAQYATNTGWKAVAGFGPGAAYTNPLLPAGSAVWIRGATTNDQKVAIAGEVVMTGAATNAVVAGLQLVANPFSEQVALSNLAIHVNAEGHYNNAGQADQIMVWDAGSQGYQNLALYDLRSFGAQYASNTGWKAVAGFGPTSAYVNVTLKPGQGFWFKAVNGSFQWVESNDYKAGLE